MTGASAAAAVRQLEERAFNAWPALQTVLVDGWLVRFADGYTKRANSASPYLLEAAPAAAVLATVEALYRRHGLPPIFRLTPLGRVDDSAALEAHGYRAIDTSLVMTAPLAPSPAPDGSVTLEARPAPGWLDGFAAGNRHGPGIRPALDTLLAAIRLPTAYATLGNRDGVHGYGLGVVERGMVGLFDILVNERARRRGFGRRLVAALMDWGRREGARTAYLQVTADNAAALGLYRSLGFEVVYSYGYWTR
jgi:GNAT superfamily N-acetyltransferase